MNANSYDFEKTGNGIWIKLIEKEKSFWIKKASSWIVTAEKVVAEIVKIEKVNIPCQEIKIHVDGSGSKKSLQLTLESMQGICNGEYDNEIAYAKAFVKLLENFIDPKKRKIWIG